jgi:N-acetylneuraminic acid mutarotase
MMEKPSSTHFASITTILIGVFLGFSILAFTSACVFNESDENGVTESTYGWSWEAGSDMPGDLGVYGTKGIPSTSNYPGARGYHVLWKVSNGLIWIFGGHADDSAFSEDEINDLWRYNPGTGEWTWVGGSNLVNQPGTYGVMGVSAPANIPGARDTCASWRDSDDRLWLFGGFGHDSTGGNGNLNDLWMFDPATMEWTWVAGSDVVGQAGTYGAKGVPAAGNTPGARYGAVSWTDAQGIFWLFGGLGSDSAGSVGNLNDLWNFDPATCLWAWISGSDVRNEIGFYGTKGVTSPFNNPGAREGSAAWIDSNDRLWLFGGYGRADDATSGQLGDVWMFDPATEQWTWIAGPNAIDQAGVYGTQGIASTLNNPGGGNGAIAWNDPAGKFWIFGGQGRDEAGNQGSLNDLWKFDPDTAQWTWVAGSKKVNQTGDLSGLGKRYLSNNPGGREYGVGWIDAIGNLWLIGGKGYGSSGTKGYLNDMWEYIR